VRLATTKQPEPMFRIQTMIEQMVLFLKEGFVNISKIVAWWDCTMTD
jgi:hypothetical protein